MFCVRCGADVTNEAVCPWCGTEVPTRTSLPSAVPPGMPPLGASQGQPPPAYAEPGPHRSKVPAILLGVLVGVLLLALAGVSAALFVANTGDEGPSASTATDSSADPTADPTTDPTADPTTDPTADPTTGASPEPSPAASPSVAASTPTTPAPSQQPSQSSEPTADGLDDVATLPAGLFCRDLYPRGYSYSAAVRYWNLNGNPDQMDADRNGIPCETVYPPDDVSAYWSGRDAPPAFDDPQPLPAGLYCRDLHARGLTYSDAVAYWWAEGLPDRMDADLNGIPCETVYPADDVAGFWS